MSDENPELRSERVMEFVRDRVRAETLAANDSELESLLLLARELRESRERLLERLGGEPLLPQPPAQLDFELFLELDRAGQNQELPAAPEIERVAPLHFLHKAWRKIALKTQRQFNRAAVRLFRATLLNLMRVELNQLGLFAELRRLHELEERIAALERKANTQQTGQNQP